MKKLFLILIILLAFFLESRVTVFGAPPNLTAAAAYFFGFRNGGTKGLLFGSLIGLLSDSLSGNLLGPGMLGKGLVGFSASFLSGSYFRWTPFLGVFGIFALSACDGVIEFSAIAAFKNAPTTFANAFSIILISSAVNAVFGLFMRPPNE